MNRSRWRWLPVVLAIALCFSAKILSAQEGKGSFPPPFPPDPTRSPLLQELNLSQEQKDKIQQIHEKSQGDFEKTRETLHAAKQSLDQAMEGNLSDQEILKRFEVFQKFQQTMMRAGFEQALEVRKILDPEQRKKFSELRKKHFEEMRANHPGMPPFPPPPL